MPAPVSKQWVIGPSDAEACAALSGALGVHRLTAAVLVARGHRSVSEARVALDGADAPGPDPFLLAGMEQAVDRLHQARRRREQVLAYGDYDVDGACATSLYLGFLKSLGLAASFYIPHRVKEGYGLQADAVRRIAASGTTLLITADCGTTSHDEIALARSLGLDVIVLGPVSSSRIARPIFSSASREFPSAPASARPLLTSLKAETVFLRR